MRKVWTHRIAFSILLLLFTSCAKRENPANGDSPHSGRVPIPEIRTAVVGKGMLQKKVTLAGQISLTETGKADITAPLSGIVVRPLVKVGDPAAKGAPIALVNSIYGQSGLQIIQKLEADTAAFSQAEDNAKQTQAELRNATLDYARKQNLFSLYWAFRKLSDVFLILGTVPLALIGGILSLLATHTPFSVSAAVGFTSLFGVSVLEGVLLLSRINHARKQGLPLTEAIVSGCELRLRPLLMVAFSAAVGLLPAAISHDIGAQAQQPLARVVVGGILTSALLILLVIPPLYLLLHWNRVR